MFELIFHPEAEEEILSLESKMQAKALAALDKLEVQGNHLRYPDTDTIQDGLFELRVGKKDITRTFFAFAKEKRIYILRTFVKKTAKTPKNEIKLAIKRLEELTNEN
ncbi:MULTISPECIES: type II toxin-antitoxin system RelE/ParE family toxin [Thorsellia]|uniref:Phage-related protein n=2 Tax=Thorsellia TaxID=336803 RepID=A0A1I0E2X3_9GAMM|nr:type II toxin-antitoxin system RelE/ParE family toxin [Thorsellia anophelis]SET39428.1 Phage-related protein [Thorsellia anophelis DSM 18579]